MSSGPEDATVPAAPAPPDRPPGQSPGRPAAIRTRGLTKAYDGTLALDHLDLEILGGDIFGYIGPNGAGKTTTIRILAALLLPTGGAAEVAGVDVLRRPKTVKALVGYMPDAFGVYDNMTLLEYLDFFAAAFRIRRPRRRRVIDDVLALTDLGAKRDDQVSAFSRGMKQRACLAKTLLHDPEVLILDEPASGLDPRARIELRELLKELQRMGKTILVSSHILTELSTVCNTVGIIEKGRLVAAGDVESILRSVRAHRQFILQPLEAADAGRAAAALKKEPAVKEVTQEGGALRLLLDATEVEIARLVELLAAEGVRFTELREEHADLETAFMTLTRGELA
jgi:ABC-2 type transport system ATP-binding protein